MAQIFVSPWAQYTDASGNPGSGDKLYFYATGTTTPSTIYSDVGLTTPQANPAIADSAGQWPAIYLDDTLHKVVMTTAADVTIRTVDPVFTVATGSKGADIPSATALDVGSTNDFFHVTGTVSITSVTTRTAGTRVALAFDSALTVAHNASSLILPDAHDILTYAGYVLELISEGSGNWRCLNYPATTPWVAYTPTISAAFGTPTNIQFFSRKVGNTEIEVDGSFIAGTVAASEASVTFGFSGTSGNVTASASHYHGPLGSDLQHVVGNAVCSGLAVPIVPITAGTTSKIYFGLVSAGGTVRGNGNQVCTSAGVMVLTVRITIT